MNDRFAAGVATVGCLLLVAVAMRNRGVGADDGDRTEAVRAALRGGTARNVILFIGDGMGDSEITAARNYAVGPGGRLALDTLPLTGAYTTYSVDERNPELPDFVTDSAASGTAWATGHKTSNGRISTSPGDDRDLQTILELAQRRGYRTRQRDDGGIDRRDAGRARRARGEPILSGTRGHGALPAGS